MLLNCDLGESYGQWTMGNDENVMPHIDLANVACGFHAGDPSVMAKTLKLAKVHHVEVGAHPSYPDLQGFGRRSMSIQNSELKHLIHYQIAALEGMARCQGLRVSYVKPHGALYNDMMKSDEILATVMTAIAEYPTKLKLMMLATTRQDEHRLQAKRLGIDLVFEAFADRRYSDSGMLLPRSEAGAVLSQPEIMDQVTMLSQSNTVRTISGNLLTLKADTLCVHGDNEAGITLIQHIKSILKPA